MKATSLQTDLFNTAVRVRENSYSPYSGYKVASALVTDSGKIYAGVNVENASYGATICAERSAIFSAISAGEKKVSTILVLTDEAEPWAPCGMCRQVLIEFCKPSTEVILANLQGPQRSILLSELVPWSFSKEQLKQEE